MKTRKKIRVHEVIGGLGMPALKYGDYLKELVIRIVREHPEVNLEEIYVSTDVNGCICLFYDRYMTDEELNEHNIKLDKLREEVETSGLLDDYNEKEQPI
jgi:hypothetical protein